MPAEPTTFEETLKRQASAADGQLRWPDSWQTLAEAGVLGWAIPTEYGGQGLDGVALLTGYERLAAACLTTAFILSQRDAAVRRILVSTDEALRRELLRPLACGGRFATVGLSQLTTSRQHQKPALTASLTARGLVLNGFMPWVTGAPEADHFVTGAVMEDGQQILAVLPGGTPGVQVEAPLELMALQGSLTAEVRCVEVTLPRKYILAGPAAQVMTGSRGGTGGLETSCLALGLSGAAIDYLHDEARVRPELRGTAENLEQDRCGIRRDLHRPVEQGSTPSAATELRTRANNLVLRATQAALTAAKGTGFLRSHPAQRWARQALFFLVWSCPRPVAEATLAYLAPPSDETCPA